LDRILKIFLPSPCTVHFSYHKFTSSFAISHTSGFFTSSPAIYLYFNYYQLSNRCKRDRSVYATYDSELPLEVHLAVLTSYAGTFSADNDIYTV